ncbi:antizyme inhibitor 2-like, partial [Parasteatoda tepidariorum]|uniref:antizyme inhibitor 2-like n=1 Tax=Parasteatoda tepidariorum TaxID=114398 RepID=UPI0039BC814D
ILYFSAVKAHSDPILIRLFVLLGFSFDCSTKGEISLVLKNCGKPQNIIYAHTIKPHSSLKYAREIGVDLMTFDCEEELEKIKKFYPTARLVVRIKGESPQCSYDLNVKYGCYLEEVKQLFVKAKDLDLNVIGISFHVGALCVDPTSYSKTIHSSRILFDFAEGLGLHLTLLDIGGGFFGSKERENFFNDVSSEIRNSVEKYFPDNSVRVIAEPGCYFVGSAQRNVTCVLGKRSVNKHQHPMNKDKNETENDEIKRQYFINDGYYTSFFRQFELYDIYARPFLVSSEIRNSVEKYFPDNSVRVIAEPGCYFVGSAQRNVTCILGKRSVKKHLHPMNKDKNETENDEIKRQYFINDGYYTSFFRQFELYDIYARPFLKQEEVKKRPIYKSTIWGQTCCCEDYVIKECSLPELNDGEYLVWENMGAYTLALASQFTIVPIPQAKRVFIKNSRLNLDWIENLEEVTDFLGNNVVLIESEKVPS